MTQPDPYRLPHTATPHHYAVVLEPDIDAATFGGSARIDATVHIDCDHLLLNAADLDVSAMAVERQGVSVALDVVADPDLERIAISPADGSGFAPGPIAITATFTGELNDQLRGFYRSTYVDADGTPHTLATSQLQSTDARRVFPCWDEPEFKATFGFTLVVDDDLFAVSNGAVVSDEPTGDGRRRVTFADTPKMSSYLGAFIVGELEASRTVTSAGGVPIRVITPPGKTALGEFALDCATFCLDFFAEYYDLPYIGSKLDLVAVPDFAAGAMENLGCVTFRETALLVDPETSTRAEQERVADVIAHEIAHMWFGDLVTMRWWNGIWLNEAFATFMEMLAVDAYRPAWGRWITEKLDRDAAFAIDSLATTRPIEFPVHAPSDAEGMFDLLTYIKGGGVLRMLEQYLGHDGFRDGVRHYLRRHAYDSTETADLWDALEEVTGEPCRQIMDSWINQGGYPLVTVRRGDTDESLVLDQHRYRFEGSVDDGANDHDNGPGEWTVPVVLRVLGEGGDLEHRLVLDPMTTPVDLGVSADAVVGNADAEGFYRVAYDDSLRTALADRLDRLTAVERLAFVSDQWAAVLAGQLDGPGFLELIGRFGTEDHPDVWKAINEGLGGLSRVIDDDTRAAFESVVSTLATTALDRIAMEPGVDDDTERRRTRAALLTLLAVTANDPAGADWARRVLAEPDRADTELAAVAPAAVAAHGDATTWDDFWSTYRSADTPQVEQRYLFALAQFRQPELAQVLLERCREEIRSQDAPFLINRLLGNRHVRDLAWRAVRDDWALWNERFPRNTIGRMVQNISTVSDPRLAADIAAFFAEHPIEQAAMTLRQYLDQMRVNVTLAQREGPRLRAHLGG